MQHYTLDNHLLIQTDREILFCTPEEVVVMEKEESPIEALQDSQMLSIFPEAKKAILTNIKERRDRFEELEALRPEIRDLVTENVRSVADQEKAEELAFAIYIDLPQKKITAEIHKYERMLNWQKHKDDATLIKAKAFPITDLIEFNNAGFAKCLWHTDKTPSLKHYSKTNSIYCFSCNYKGDSLDVYRHLNNCSLQEAIKALS